MYDILKALPSCTGHKELHRHIFMFDKWSVDLRQNAVDWKNRSTPCYLQFVVDTCYDLSSVSVN